MKPQAEPMNFSHLGAALVAEGGAHGQRRLVVLSGERTWCIRTARAVLAGAGLERVLWVTDREMEGEWTYPAAKARKLLGQELDGVVFDAYAGFDPEAFGALGGTVRGGGLFLLLTPPLESWHEYDDPEHARIAVHPTTPEEVSGRFLARMARHIGRSVELRHVVEGASPPAVPLPVEGAPLRPAGAGGDCATDDQRRAVEAIGHVAHGHRHRPLVLTSDRGRGKSAALGIAAARLLGEGLRRIIVTGPRYAAVEQVFAHAARLLPAAEVQRGRLLANGGVIEFAPPDSLSLDPRPAELLLVDEAAAIPAPLLARLLEHYARIVFATTIHGYEGTGRGFAVRFNRVLGERTPGWRSLRLETPVRWAAGDPLERFINRALLLDAAPTAADGLREVSAEACSIERVGRDALLNDEATLSQLFGLLVLAHYRTTPMDLRNLLDGPNLAIYLMRHNGQVVATALAAREGGFDATLARAIYTGRRRPRGHLMPQSLAVHAGFVEAPELSAERIMRIAVHPAVQQRGLGSRLVDYIRGRAAAEGCDYLGSSFGATGELLRFWSGIGLLPVRLGLSRDASSGTHSAMVMSPLSTAGERLFAAARQRFLAHLPALLAEPLRDLEPAMARMLLETDGQAAAVELDEQDWRDLVSFAFARRGYEVCMVPIRKLLRLAITRPEVMALLGAEQQALLVNKVLQGMDWSEAARRHGYAGRGPAVEALRRAVGPLVRHCGGERVTVLLAELGLE